MTSCFCVFLLRHRRRQRGVGDFRLCVKIQQLVVLGRCFFGCFCESTGKTVTYQMFVCGDGLCGDRCCPHENSLLKSHMLDFGPSSLTPRLRMGLFSLLFKNMTHQKDSLFSFQCQNVLCFFNNIHKKHISLITL